MTNTGTLISACRKFSRFAKFCEIRANFLHAKIGCSTVTKAQPILIRRQELDEWYMCINKFDWLLRSVTQIDIGKGGKIQAPACSVSGKGPN